MGLDLTGKRIFVVEDNARNRVIYQVMLMRYGAHITFDNWGRETLERLRQHRTIDVIILDLGLGNGPSGYDVFAEIRHHPEYDEIPIVAVSAADPSIALPKTRDMGFSGFIAKPIEDDIFPEQIARVINGEKIWYAGTYFKSND
jgi:two-component system cell cycle response regulator DivK